MIRTLYPNGAAIFMSPNKDDMILLASTLHHFEDFLMLVTNCTKCQVKPLRFAGLDLDHIIQDFLATRTNFLMKYLGLT
jgi:hypothetical protein